MSQHRFIGLGDPPPPPMKYFLVFDVYLRDQNFLNVDQANVDIYKNGVSYSDQHKTSNGVLHYELEVQTLPEGTDRYHVVITKEGHVKCLDPFEFKQTYTTNGKTYYEIRSVAMIEKLPE